MLPGPVLSALRGWPWSHLNACLPQQFMEIEPEMLAMETIVPVYFAVEDEALLSIYEQTQAASASRGSASAAEGGLGPQGQGGHPGACRVVGGATPHCSRDPGHGSGT